MRLVTILCAVLVAASVQAAEFTVDSTVDSVDVSPGDGVCADSTGACTLRAAVMETNELLGEDVIEVQPGSYALSIAGSSEDAGATGDLDVLDAVRIVGSGAAGTIIDAAGIDRVFHVQPGPVEISGVTIAGGFVCPSVGPLGDQLCGGGELGGGILAIGAPLTLRDSTISGNTAGWGGGIVADDLRLARVTVSDNWGGQGAALVGSQMVIVNSSISRNTTVGFSLYHPPGELAAIEGGVVRLENSTIADNLGGDEIYALSGSVESSGSIVANPDLQANCETAATSHGYNIDSDGTCNLTDPTDLPNTDPVLSPLQDNGGPTPTHALLAGSPAIDAIAAADCTWDDDDDPATPEVPLFDDQRGVFRPLGGACDIGAYEVTACADGIDNDGDGLVDFDGGVTAGLPQGEVTAPDLQCDDLPTRNRETRRRCGLGYELAMLLPGLMWLRRSRQP